MGLMFNHATKVACVGLVSGLFAAQASAGAWVYTGDFSVDVGWSSSDGFYAEVSGTCKVSYGSIPDPGDTHSLLVGVHTGKPNSNGDVTLGWENLTYDADLSREYNERWGTSQGEWQFYRSMPMVPPTDYNPVDLDLSLSFDGAGNTVQVYITNDTPTLYDEVVYPAMATATKSNTATGNINVAGGTTNEVRHSCSSTSAPMGAGALAGLLALGLRRRRQS